MATEIAWEEGLLGMTWLYYQEVKPMPLNLDEDDFLNPDCRKAWAEFKASADAEDYISRLDKVRLLTQMGHWSILEDSPIIIPSAIPCAISKIKRDAIHRRLASGLQRAWDNEDDLLNGMERLLERERQKTPKPENSPQQLYLDTIEEMLNNDLDQRIYTGLTEVDSILGGLRKGNISVIGAEPSTGKTALALNIAHHALGKGRTVLFFSLEMSAVQLMQRLIASEGKLSYFDISNKRLGQEGKELFSQSAARLLGTGKLFIYDTIYQIEQMAERMSAIKPDLVVVDFLQFCRTVQPSNTTADKLEYIVSEFKRLSKRSDQQCHVLLLSQPSRQSGVDKQSMFTLKGSSAIEQGGDVILMLDRPHVRDTKIPPPRASLKISKNKFGCTGLVKLVFDGGHQRFRDYTAEDAVYWQSEEERRDKPW